MFISVFFPLMLPQIAFIWSCLDAQDDRKDDDQKAADKATQAPELFTKYQKILNEEGIRPFLYSLSHFSLHHHHQRRIFP